MDLIKGIFGIGKATGALAEVFVANKTKSQSQDHLRAMGAQTQFRAEFQHPRVGPFDQFVDGLNRLPRPVMALGTVGLFCFAMIDPNSFAVRMQGLDYVPDPLWWLLGAIVSFYFGAREMHHFRQKRIKEAPLPALQNMLIPSGSRIAKQYDGDNAAIADWYAEQSNSG